MRVLHVIPSLSPLRGGPTAVALNFGRELRAQGVEVEICTTNDHGPAVLPVPLGERVEYEGVPVWFFPRFNVPLQRLSLGGDRSFLFSIPWTRWLWENLPRYDVLDTHYLFAYGSTAAATIAHLRHVPYTMRTMGQLAPWALAQSRKKKQVYSALIERRSLNHAALVHCTTPGEAADVRNFGITAKTAILPLGVTPGAEIPDAAAKLRQTYAIPDDRPIILFLSRIHYKKRPDLLLNAVARLGDRTPYHVLLAGEFHSPDYAAELTAQVQRLGLSDRVTFTGLVTGWDKELVLQGSDLFVLPSFAENFAIAVAEAMAAGLPVVITPEVQIAPDVDQAGAGRVIPGTVEDLAACLAELLSNPEQCHNQGEQGKQWARSHYHWPTITQHLITHYHTALQSPGF
ncbi:glycosyltransferase [Spirulina major]|uniref:glycosyltransferase n=1 Tax=Spirulina major TaxID=270636 RepID=UPI000934F3AB|nr:glycosyltransferase [Spirulina major]